MAMIEILSGFKLDSKQEALVQDKLKEYNWDKTAQVIKFEIESLYNK